MGNNKKRKFILLPGGKEEQPTHKKNKKTSQLPPQGKKRNFTETHYSDGKNPSQLIGMARDEDYHDLLMYFYSASENLQLMNKNLLGLKDYPQNLFIIQVIFRAVRTLKQMSVIMGFIRIANLTHEIENLMDLCRRKPFSVTREIINVIFQTFSILNRLIDDIFEGIVTVSTDDYQKAIDSLKKFLGNEKSD
ncbi:Hpt domain-containing protein [Candidatus Riflebacteria bacterium]